MASRQRYYVGESTQQPGQWVIVYDVMGLPRLYATTVDQEKALFIASLLNQAEHEESVAARDALLPMAKWLQQVAPPLLEQLATMAEFHLEYEEPGQSIRTALNGFVKAIEEVEQGKNV